jgi:hypothetical protein
MVAMRSMGWLASFMYCLRDPACCTCAVSACFPHVIGALSHAVEVNAFSPCLPSFLRPAHLSDLCFLYIHLSSHLRSHLARPQGSDIYMPLHDELLEELSQEKVSHRERRKR